MAAVTNKSGKAPKAKAASKSTTKSAGALQLSSAYWKQYTAAYNAAANAQRTKIALNAAATRFRGYRLQAANATIKAYRAKTAQANAAAVATFAVKQSWRQARLGHQNANLQNRVYQDYQRHVTILGRLQYAQAGERKYVTQAVMRTVTQAQALSYQAKIFAQAASTAKRATASTTATATATSTKKKTALSSAQQAQIKAAGSAAGAKVPKTYTAASSNTKAAATRKAAAPGMSRHESRWIGRPEVPNCVPVALMNAMLYSTGYRPGRLFFRRLERECGPEVTIRQALGILSILLRDGDHPVRLAGHYQGVFLRPGDIIGYESEYGAHAALSLSGRRVISWGMELDFEGVTEEAWHLTWTTGSLR